MQSESFMKNTLVFHAYEDDYLQINQQKYYEALLLIDNQVQQPWGADSVAELSQQDFLFLEKQRPEILLIGTGSLTRFPSQAVMLWLDSLHVPFECMSSAAAARTFNLLLSEGRNVAAAMLLPKSA